MNVSVCFCVGSSMASALDTTIYRTDHQHHEYTVYEANNQFYIKNCAQWFYSFINKTWVLNTNIKNKQKKYFVQEWDRWNVRHFCYDVLVCVTKQTGFSPALHTQFSVVYMEYLEIIYFYSESGWYCWISVLYRYIYQGILLIANCEAERKSGLQHII